MVSRSYRRLNRYSNSARYRGTCFSRTARYVPTRAALILPNAVLTHLKAGVRTACLPLPVFIEVCRHPAWVTAAKHARPSETILAPGLSAVLCELSDREAAEGFDGPKDDLIWLAIVRCRDSQRRTASCLLRRARGGRTGRRRYRRRPSGRCPSSVAKLASLRPSGTGPDCAPSENPCENSMFVFRSTQYLKLTQARNQNSI